jgi:hypothetical protein
MDLYALLDESSTSQLISSTISDLSTSLGLASIPDPQIQSYRSCLSFPLQSPSLHHLAWLITFSFVNLSSRETSRYNVPQLPYPGPLPCLHPHETLQPAHPLPNRHPQSTPSPISVANEPFSSPSYQVKVLLNTAVVPSLASPTRNDRAGAA